MRAILVALSMPSAGLDEPELDAGLGVGVALDVSRPAMLLPGPGE